ncbi:hypothetical protein HA402_009930 [Bradysia odoriphaga]|nr:hypothetical protein HA402_009930 [Bradysia odoriphaga]
MLKIVPPDAITFNYIGNELVGTLILENIIQEHVAFKIKATSEPKFTIRPDTGWDKCFREHCDAAGSRD